MTRNKIFHSQSGFLCCILIVLCTNCRKDVDNMVIIKDIDGNVYHTICIGRQVWMSENLKTTHYRNGDTIINVTDASQWSHLTTGAFCNYGNYIENADTYGRLYNWYAVTDERKISPEGWHIATDSEWLTLIDFLGGDSIAGSKLKEEGNKHWIKPNTNATNESGFTALPGGFRTYCCGAWEFNGGYGYWWTAPDISSDTVWFREMSYQSTICKRIFGSKNLGQSVRCVKD
jgi:uncharacterized protein (TIGR02145 family)